MSQDESHRGTSDNGEPSPPPRRRAHWSRAVIKTVEALLALNTALEVVDLVLSWFSR
ncbi:hypothetical protein [Nocardia sp. NPDC004260]